MNLGGRYDFSRRTYVYALYSRLTNGSLARYSNVAINPNSGGAADPQAGEDITAIGVGVSHSF
jgi:predicted porin